MTVPAKSIISLCLLVLIFQSCYPEIEGEQDMTQNNQDVNRYPGVDSQLWSYFNSFEQEALARGINIDLVVLEVTGVIENISENNVAGTCQYGQHIHHVTIDQNYWNRSSAFSREMVVYHELGHCALYQGHRELEDTNGHCLSIMNSGTSGCRVLYNEANRDYYLDELFDFTD